MVMRWCTSWLWVVHMRDFHSGWPRYVIGFGAHMRGEMILTGCGQVLVRICEVGWFSRGGHGTSLVLVRICEVR
jgi:hypothetical protein